MRRNIKDADEILNVYFPVSNYGFVALTDYMGGDLSVERFARGSYEISPRGRSLLDTRKLLRFLKRNAHTSPFECTELSFHLAMPIFVARQWVRTRTASLNEMSARYTVLPTLFYDPQKGELKFQGGSNKQCSGDPVDDEIFEKYLGRHHQMTEGAKEGYRRSLEQGVSRELARIDLPLSVYTYFNWKIDLHNLFHFLNLRCKSNAQPQTQAFADVVAAITKRVAPVSFDAFYDYQYCSTTFSRMEMAVLQSVACDPKNNMDQIKHALFHQGVEDPREQTEFIEKLKPKSFKTFDLDLSEGRDGSQIMERIQHEAAN